MNCDGSFRSCHGNRISRSKTQDKWVGIRRKSHSSRTWDVLVRASGKKCQVVFVTTEVAPWSKVGGLGDVMAALPAALAARGHRVMTVSPMYSNYSDVRDTGVRAPVQLPCDIAAAVHQSQPQQLSGTQAGDPAARKAATVYAQHDGPAAEDVAKAAAVYERAQAAEAAAGSSTGGSAGVCVDYPSYVRYHMCCSSGVHRVFVQHPLYHGSSTKGRDKQWPAAVMSSYCHPNASGHAGGPDLAAAASVLCQAALAAPLLLWGITRSVNKQYPQQAMQQTAQDGYAQQQQLEMSLLIRLLGLEHSQAAAEYAAGVPGQTAGNVATLLRAATQLQQAELAVGMQYPQQIIAGHAQPVLLGTGGSEVDRRWPVCDLLLPRSQQFSDEGNHMGSASDSDDDSMGPLVFVANDWPCGVLPLWLDTYRQEAQQQQWQQQNPHLDWLREQQHAVFHLQQQQHNLAELAQAAVEAGSSRDNSSVDMCVGASAPGSNADTAVVFECAAVSKQGANLASPDVEAQQLLQVLQQDWQEAAANHSGASMSSCPEDHEQPFDVAKELKESLAGSRSWSDAAEAWLGEVGYQPESVFDAQLAAVVSSAIADGRVTPATLPALASAQAQLRQLLQQEQALGDAIQRLKSATIQLQREPAEPNSSQSSRTAMYAAAPARSQVQMQQPAAGAATVQPMHLSHDQELALLQQLLGRQLGDAKVAFAVHNFGYQGTFKGQQHFKRLGLPGRLLSAFTAPVAHAAQVTANLGGAVGTAAAAAVAVVGSQLAALVEALQHLGRCKTGRESCDSSSSGQGSSYGLLASVQELLQQASVHAAAEAASAAALDNRQWVKQAETAKHQQVVASRPALYVSAEGGQSWQPAQCTTASPNDSLVLNWMAAGVSTSDAVVTVSPGYARELLGQSSPVSSQKSSLAGSSLATGSTSHGMEALLAAKQLRGILNGLDTTFWDPAADPLLPASVRFSPCSVQHGKAAAKELLQRRLGLAVDADAPLFAFVGRLTAQKGVDVMLAAMPQVLESPKQQQGSPGVTVHVQPDTNSAKTLWQRKQHAANTSGSSEACAASSVAPVAVRPRVPQLVLLGAGERWMEHVLGQLAGRYPGHAVGVPDFNEPLAHLIMAGADFLLIPSRFEPCGLVALAGLRYGAVPIATATGGLADIVSPAVGYQVVNPAAEGDTASFRRGVAGLVAAMKQAAAEYGSPEFQAKRAAAMAMDVSWDAPCAAWEQLLLQLAEQDTAASAVKHAAAAGDDAVELPDCVAVDVPVAFPSL